jgi:hypothetical protein
MLHTVEVKVNNLPMRKAFELHRLILIEAKGKWGCRMLPPWMQWIQACAVLFIAGVGTWIAFKQARIAAAKLNLDLYDRRFKVFDAARYLVGKVVTDACPGNDDFNVFNLGVADAVFLFDSDVTEYLDNLRKAQWLCIQRASSWRD